MYITFLPGSRDVSSFCKECSATLTFTASLCFLAGEVLQRPRPSHGMQTSQRAHLTLLASSRGSKRRPAKALQHLLINRLR